MSFTNQFTHGDRVRWTTMGDDGLPLVRYGFVGGVNGNGGPVMVMLDGELKGSAVDPSQLEPVSVTTVELHLDGDDLLGDETVRPGLLGLWQAEAESAGLDLSTVQHFGPGFCDEHGRWTLAELASGGQRYVVRAQQSPTNPQVAIIRADPA
jgi:hypothetical protein